jgi:hypothetical protein
MRRMPVEVEMNGYMSASPFSMAISSALSSRMMRMTISSSFGRPSRKKFGFFLRMIASPGVNSSSMKGPAPMGAELAGWVLGSCPSP